MSYRVLARAYRSGTFDEIVGQEAIAATLKNAISSGRIHHGYLFTGTRGVGKTSMARIVAKSLNCQGAEKPTITPCGQCSSCVAIAAGEDVDVVEIDAASNTGVDNIRELRSNAAFRPARARFKVYIIDEVHMLSTGAFNALLKTLEEPPPHVKFILATTDPQKVPATIQSRCQRFDFRAIEGQAITAHLRVVVDAENVPADDGVLRRIARLSGGSMRDALSLLDQLISYAPDGLTLDSVEQLIPTGLDEHASAILDAVSQGDPAAALLALAHSLDSGRTVERTCESLIEHVRTLMLVRVCGRDTELVDVPSGRREQIDEQARRFEAPTYVYLIALLEALKRNARFSGAGRALIEAGIVRMALVRNFSDVAALIDRLDDGSEGRVERPQPAPPGTGGRNLPAPSGTNARPPGGTSSLAPPGQVADPGSAPGDRRAGATKSRDPTRDNPSAPTTPSHRGTDRGPRIDGPGSSTTIPTALATGSAEKRYVEPADDAVESPPPAPSAGKSSATTGTAEWERIARDPRVREICDAVEGTLFDVRPARALTPSPDSESTADPNPGEPIENDV